MLIIYVQAKPPPASPLGDSTFGKYTFYRLMCDGLGFLPTLFILLMCAALFISIYGS